MKFLIIKNNDIGTAQLAVVFFNDMLYSVAYNFTVESVFKHFFSSGRVIVEQRVDYRTIHKREVRKTDSSFFEAIKTKLPAPYAVYLSGEIFTENPEEALQKLWRMFSRKEPRLMVEM